MVPPQAQVNPQDDSVTKALNSDFEGLVPGPGDAAETLGQEVEELAPEVVKEKADNDQSLDNV